VENLFGGANPEGLLADAFFQKGQYTPEHLFSKIQSLLEQSPIRPSIPKPDKAPVWIPRDGKYLVLTCTECLRSFSIPQEEARSGLCELPCIHCGTLIRFICEDIERVKQNPPEARERVRSRRVG
jgi:hypothetical protein